MDFELFQYALVIAVFGILYIIGNTLVKKLATKICFFIGFQLGKTVTFSAISSLYKVMIRLVFWTT